MGASISIRPRARQDIVDQAVYIAGGNLPAAERFLDAVEEALESIAEMPKMGTFRHFDNRALAGIRIWPVNGFGKHLLSYRVVKNGIELVRVLHAARDIGGVMDGERD